MKTRAFAILTLALASSVAVAADQEVLGRSLRVDGAASSDTHRVAVVARQTVTAALSDPTTGGATLTIVANGATSTSQTYLLDASGWQPLGGKGFRYLGPTGADGDPVKRVLLKRSTSGALMLKIDVRDTVGTQPVTIVPPNPGTDGGAVLDVTAGDRYCIVLGGAAGGTVTRDSADHWKIARATATAGCPSFASTTTTATSTSTTTTLDCLPDGTYQYQIPPMAPCCSGGTCRLVGPSTCACGPACETFPSTMCSGKPCYFAGPPEPNIGCVPLRIVMESGTHDGCGCPPVGECPCPCPSGQICQADFTTSVCSCVPE